MKKLRGSVDGVEVFAFCAILAAVGFILFLVISNARNAISEGELIRKYYEPARTYTNYTSVNGIIVPYNQYTPEKYYFEIRGEKNGEIVEYSFNVTAGEYAEYQIGDHYPKRDDE